MDILRSIINERTCMISLIEQYKEICIDYADSMEEWLNRTSHSLEEIHKNNITAYENQFIGFSNEYKLLMAERERVKPIHAWDFNIFDTILFNRPETNLHTPFLKNLLNPKGSHGQNDTFYKLFLKHILKDDQRIPEFLNESYSDYLIPNGDKFIRNSETKNGGFIDIFIESANLKKPFAIIIENKWLSPDSGLNQLYKYYRHYTFHNEKRYNDKNLLVIYLTKHGRDPDRKKITKRNFNTLISQNKDINYFTLSYKKNIRAWLNECVEHCQSEKVKWTIEQYIEILK